MLERRRSPRPLDRSSEKHIHFKKIRSGKSKELYDIGFNEIGFYHSDRVSCFNKEVTKFEGKGFYINNINNWWMKRTSHIIPNHLIYCNNVLSVCRKTEPIPLEVIVRGYVRNENIPEDLSEEISKKYILQNTILTTEESQIWNEITPIVEFTRKSETDEPITKEEILKEEILDEEELSYIEKISLELFHYGRGILHEKDLLLLDTKYEFGKTTSDEIILIDEIHTPDSSRIVSKGRYLDKEYLRYNIKKKIQIIDATIEELKSRYWYYSRYLLEEDWEETLPPQFLFNEYFIKGLERCCVILVDSKGEITQTKLIEKYLERVNIRNHKYSFYLKESSLESLQKLLDKYNKRKNVIWISVSPKWDILGNLVSYHTKHPVISYCKNSIGIPNFTSIDDLIDFIVKILC